MPGRFALIALLVMVSPAGAADQTADHFFSQVEPLIRGQCIQCHGPEKQEGGLRLDSRGAVLKGGDSGPAAVPGDPDHSLLLEAVRHSKPGLEMPPELKLDDAQIAALVKWVQDGAVWPVRAEPSPPPQPSRHVGDAWSDPHNPIVKLFQGQRLDLWSLQKPVRPARPAVLDRSWPQTAIDDFILARLESRGLAPSSPADRSTLIRRVYFDLIGLPPTPEEVRSFAGDPAPDAYVRLVERLLASPRYGERWGRHWLDVVRYSDTNGFERDEFRPTVWRYRDYVVRSFNADKPYDEFVRQQLAGDEMVAGRPQDAADADKLIATGYMRLGPYDSTRSIFEEDQVGHDQLMADLVNTTGAAMLGMTLSCCQCHDHKYDPLSQADHYRMRAFFAAVKPCDEMVIDTAGLQDEITRHNEPLEKTLEEHRASSQEIVGAAKKRVADDRRAKFPAEIVELLKIDEKERDAETKAKLTPFLEQLDVKDKDALAALHEEEQKRYDELKEKIAELKDGMRSCTTALGMNDVGSTAPATHVFYQGDHTQPRDAVTPGFFSVLDPNPTLIAAPKSAATTGRRTALADWITSRDNPLTARVIVNRIWQHHFGRGLVATPNDFGYSGQPPTHPELLDWLAVELTDHGWSIKHVHRLILLSAAYRQTSVEDPARRAIDPDNSLLWRQNVQRLDAETLRDAMLAVSGRLLPMASGSPRWPPVPDEILKASPAILEEMKGESDGRKQGWYADPPEKTLVRSIYLVQKQSVLVPLLEAFDLPEMSVSCGRRNVTTVASQALTLLNGPLAVELARAFADRVVDQADSDPARRVERAFWLALAREPSEDERRTVSEMLARHEKLHAQQLGEGADHAALVDLCRALLNLNEFLYID